MAELLLLRHGIAEERCPGRDDGLRQLTPEGWRRTRQVVDQLSRLGLGGDRLITSPLARARQTADIAFAAGLAASLEASEALAPGGEALALLLARLEAQEAEQRLLLVGHEPDLGGLAARLIGAACGSIALKKAGVALLRCSDAVAPGCWQLRLLMAPRQLLCERARREVGLQP
ncbi:MULTISPECIES: phosphohistidine phosphatase SixA [unclassified Cyanobium]|uniref:phosphohistidine phosphatase SixA n=1 Tax=unclassified Cyanobium TaxID=2627006 RepID=UPI0018607FBD|nr:MULTISPECIES: phosphohistidine phosphatase SixA [unclassified Cyanobium]QNI69531.1 histidine phosphatase super family protein [Cyanobium sp. NS01]